MPGVCAIALGILHTMDQFILNQDIPKEQEPELTWVNVAIALSFILVDGTSSGMVADDSCFLRCIWSWHREIRSSGLSTMFNPTIPHGTRHLSYSNGRDSSWIKSSPHRIHS